MLACILQSPVGFGPTAALPHDIGWRGSHGQAGMASHLLGDEERDSNVQDQNEAAGDCCGLALSHFRELKKTNSYKWGLKIVSCILLFGRV